MIDRLIRAIIAAEFNKDPEYHKDTQSYGPFSEANGNSEPLCILRLHLWVKYEKKAES